MQVVSSTTLNLPCYVTQRRTQESAPDIPRQEVRRPGGDNPHDRPERQGVPLIVGGIWRSSLAEDTRRRGDFRRRGLSPAVPQVRHQKRCSTGPGTWQGNEALTNPKLGTTSQYAAGKVLVLVGMSEVNVSDDEQVQVKRSRGIRAVIIPVLF